MRARPEFKSTLNYEIHQITVASHFLSSQGCFLWKLLRKGRQKSNLNNNNLVWSEFKTILKSLHYESHYFSAIRQNAIFLKCEKGNGWKDQGHMFPYNLLNDKKKHCWHYDIYKMINYQFWWISLNTPNFYIHLSVLQ